MTEQEYIAKVLNHHPTADRDGLRSWFHRGVPLAKALKAVVFSEAISPHLPEDYACRKMEEALR